MPFDLVFFLFFGHQIYLSNRCENHLKTYPRP